MVYSPTQTDAFAFCPRYREFYVQGWQPRIADKAMVARWLGVAMAAGQEHYYKQRATLPTDAAYATPVDAALATLEGLIGSFKGVGGVVEESLLLGLSSAITRVFQNYPAIDPIPSNWQVIAVEQAFYEHGNARADLVVRTPQGLTVVDWKWKKELYVKQYETKDQARGRVLMEYDHSWSMYHYMWALQQTSTPPVAAEYYIGLGELTPKPRITLQGFPVTSNSLQNWAQNAKLLWDEMAQVDQGTRPVRGNVTHETKYGKCAFYDLCVLGDGDHTQLPVKFIQIARH